MDAKRLGLVASVAAAACALDQASKWTVVNIVMDPPRTISLLPFFDLRLGFNSGVSFGMFADHFAAAPIVLVALSVAVVVVLAYWALRCERRSEAVALGLIIGGAAGNIVDRVRLGAVVDFLDFHYRGRHWPAFNAADIAIVLGAAALIVPALFRGRASEAVRAGRP